MLRRIPRPLALLLAVAALLSVAWTFTTAPFQGPDEPAHFNYAQHLAETGHKPTRRRGRPPRLLAGRSRRARTSSTSTSSPGVADARPAWSPLEERRFDEHPREAGEAGEDDGAGPNPLAKNPPLYYAYQALPYYVGSAGLVLGPARS